MNSLRVGDVIEVEWDVNSERAVSQWWSAIVVEVKKLSAQQRPVTVIQLRYGERGGYPETRQDLLLFRQNGEVSLQCLITSEILNWRHQSNFDGDRNCINGGASLLQPAGSSSRVGLLDTYRENPAGSRTEEQLRLRVSWLEGVIAGVRCRQGATPAERLIPPRSIEHRPLLYLRESISSLLNKPLAQLGHRGRFSELFGNQDILRTQADCSLAEFEEVWEKVRSDASIHAKLFVGPGPRSRSDSAEVNERCITFGTFSDVCSALGRVSMETKLQWICKTKTRRGARAPTAVRVLGVVLATERSRDLPFCVFIGRNASRACSETQCREIPVLFRQNQVVDDVDRCFLADLQKRKIGTAEINRIISDIENHCSEDRRSFREPKFHMSWNGLQRNIGHGIFREEGYEDRVLGRLKLEIPAVIFTGAENCKEIMDLCTADFLKESLEQ